MMHRSDYFRQTIFSRKETEKFQEGNNHFSSMYGVKESEALFPFSDDSRISI